MKYKEGNKCLLSGSVMLTETRGEHYCMSIETGDGSSAHVTFISRQADAARQLMLKPGDGVIVLAEKSPSGYRGTEIHHTGAVHAGTAALVRGRLESVMGNDRNGVFRLEAAGPVGQDGQSEKEVYEIAYASAGAKKKLLEHSTAGQVTCLCITQDTGHGRTKYSLWMLAA